MIAAEVLRRIAAAESIDLDDAATDSHESLEIAVHDAWNGAQRAVSTLSGGETFTASLALALGLLVGVQRHWALRDGAPGSRFAGVYLVSPTHVVVGPFDADGAYDRASDQIGRAHV